MTAVAALSTNSMDFNKGVLANNAYFFNSADEVKKIIDTIKKIDNLQFVKNNYAAIAEKFNWNKINEEYLQFFNKCLAGNTSRSKAK